MNLPRILIAGLVAVLVVLGVAWFLQTYELVDTEEQVGFQGEAKTNDLLAARLFLRRMGVPAERRDSLQRLPDTDTVLYSE